MSLDKNTQQDRYVVHTYRVLKTSNALFSAIKDAETAQRGYILTKDTSFLTPYQHSIAAKNRLLVQLDKLIKDNKVQQQRLKHIKSLIHQKYRFVEKSLSTLHQSGSDQTIDLVNKGEGKMIMDQLRLAFQKFNTHENRLLKQRT